MTNAKRALAVGLAGALMVASMSPSLARSGRTAAAAGIGFAAGALVGAAAASNYHYGPYGTYAYSPYGGYAYEPTYDAYAYEPAAPAIVTAPGYAAPVYRQYNYRSEPRCAFDGGYRADYSLC